MKLNAKLTLSKESLRALSAEETGDVQGGLAITGGGSRFGCETCGYACGDCVSATTGGTLTITFNQQ